MNYLITLCTIGIIIALNSVDKIFDYFEPEETLTDKITSYVEARINILQKKGEFEKTSDYQIRVTQNARENQIQIIRQVGSKHTHVCLLIVWQFRRSTDLEIRALVYTKR